MSPKTKIALSLCWILLCLLRIGGRWDELHWFFFFSGREDPRALPPIDPQQVWHASDAIWSLFGLIFWGVYLVLALVSLFRAKAVAVNKEDEAEIMHF